MAFLSKSKYMVGLQCPQLLWVNYNAKDELPEVGEAQQVIFDQGNLVGDWAKKVFPKGLDVEWNQGFNEVIRESKELLTKRIPLFQNKGN